MSISDSPIIETDIKPAKLNKPFFYKKDSDADHQLEILTAFYKTAPQNVKARVEKDIKYLTYGIQGEKKVAFELENSYLPIIVLQDLHIEYDGLSVQIDYMVITKKFALIIECKNLYGNIEVSSSGEFVRLKGYNAKEAMYSPITQNTRHMDMIRKIKMDKHSNFILRAFLDKFFYDMYKTVVVLANPTSHVDTEKASKDVQNQIIRCDQLIGHIKKLLKESRMEVSSDKDMFDWANSFLRLHTPNTTDYLKKYDRKSKMASAEEQVLPAIDVQSVVAVPINLEPIEEPSVDAQIVPQVQMNTAVEVTVEPETITSAFNLEDTPIYKALKQYRFETCKAEGVQAYCIFNNAQLLAVIAAMPASLTDLKKISGFGDVKCQKYGEAILEIVRSM